MERRRRGRHQEIPPEIFNAWSNEEQAAYVKQQAMEKPIAEIGLSVRIVNTLENLGVLLVKDLLAMTTDNLLEASNLGIETLRQIQQVVKTLGLKPPWRLRRRQRRRSKKKGPT